MQSTVFLLRGSQILHFNLSVVTFVPFRRGLTLEEGVAGPHQQCSTLPPGTGLSPAPGLSYRPVETGVHGFKVVTVVVIPIVSQIIEY
jgi:hypothetical protein